MALRPLEGLSAYVDYLQADPKEVQVLSQDLLIRVTGFFRDPETFEGLVQTVFPALLEEHSPQDPVRIWVPGCASGEEVYSIAMVLIELLEERASRVPIQIFGTDVAASAIDKARTGRYLENIATEVSGERLQRFFGKRDGQYEIAQSIRDLCTFAQQNVARDPPFSRLDLISCRNLLIYLDQALQRHVVPLFHYALKPCGFLLLGASETIGAASDLFELIDKRYKIYKRKAAHRRVGFEFPRAPGALPRPGAKAREAVSALLDVGQAQREADRVILARYTPAAVLVDEDLNIVQFRGQTGPYLEHAPGPASLNLQKLARPGLLVELSPAIRQARQEGAPVRRERLRVDAQGQEVDIEVMIAGWQMGSRQG